MSRKLSSVKRSVLTPEIDESINNSNGWIQVGTYSSYDVFAKNDIRRIVDPPTGRIIVQYKINHAGESEIDAGL